MKIWSEHLVKAKGNYASKFSELVLTQLIFQVLRTLVEQSELHLVHLMLSILHGKHFAHLLQQQRQRAKLHGLYSTFQVTQNLSL